jgi:hypothetical protein
MPSLGDDDDPYLNLTIEDARNLPLPELRRRVKAIVNDLAGTMGRGSLPSDLPWRPADLTREQLLAAIERHAYWFDPHGKHPYQPAK